MPDEQLAELTARLRRLTLDGIWLADSYFDKCDVNNYHFVLARAWNPAADICQAYGLLRWAKQQGKVGFSISVGRPADELECFINGYWRFSLPDNDARAMTIAFVLAMQEAMQ